MMTLPPISEWWSRLSPEARQEVLHTPDGRLGENVREEIRDITGAVVGMAESLGRKDLAYARKHPEAED